MDRMGRNLQAEVLSSCGAGGASLFEMAYFLEESSNSTSSSQLEYFPMKPGNGNLYPETGVSSVSKGENVSVFLLAGTTNRNYLYVLKKNNTTFDGVVPGSLQGFPGRATRRT